MSGHSKWSTIKRKKGAKDAQKGKIFSRLAKAITVAARTGKNLDMAVSTAKTANMPKENIDRAIKRGTGESGEAVIEEIIYEAYAPGGVPILIKILTDNKNRAVADIRALFNRIGARLTTTGSVSYLFEQKGVIEVDPQTNKEATQLTMIDLGFDEVLDEEDRLIGYCDADKLAETIQLVESAGLKVLDTRLDFIPNLLQSVEDHDKLINILEQIEELEDVDAVYTNADL